MKPTNIPLLKVERRSGKNLASFNSFFYPIFPRSFLILQNMQDPNTLQTSIEPNPENNKGKIGI